jgi:hypothetical protein
MGRNGKPGWALARAALDVPAQVDRMCAVVESLLTYGGSRDPVGRMKGGPVQ